MSVTRPNRAIVSRAAAILAALVLAACAGEPVPPGLVSDNAAPAARAAPPVDPQQVTIAFEPFTGAPGNISDALSRRIGTEALAQDLKLVRRVGAPATYRINGYLSASGDQSSTTLFYVFDVVDGTGSRVHRIIGQESAGGAAGDPWAGVDSDALDRAARRAVAELVAWLKR
ncbi:hypothetical protein [Stappia sp. ES.058]|uniref:hypothetical protein n=1 Tax=Stappia sp. ES.058 TaxID=1881061 RepID=UPI00087AE169|nr:hypothetical protein [Stappia sp. ES.058]SDU29307.1 hypothetical protein SAMN05428979_2788 [Stappia sp. ES.058]